MSGLYIEDKENKNHHTGTEKVVKTRSEYCELSN